MIPLIYAALQCKGAGGAGASGAAATAGEPGGGSGGVVGNSPQNAFGGLGAGTGAIAHTSSGVSVDYTSPRQPFGGGAAAAATGSTGCGLGGLGAGGGSVVSSSGGSNGDGGPGYAFLIFMG